MTTLLQRMTGADYAFDAGPELSPGEVRPLTVRDSAPARTLGAFGSGAAKAGAGYALAAGAGAGVLAALGLPEYLDLLVVGGCATCAARQAAEAWGWHFRGGRLAERRRRKYQGEATPVHVRSHLSVAAAQKKMRRLAPALLAAQSYLPIGTTVHRPSQRVAVSRAETVAVFGPPQTLKTALIGNWIIEAPGVVLATPSRGDQYRLTAAVREKMGPVLVLDADGHGPGTNFAWDPVGGCADPDVAIRRAGDFMQASPRDPGGKDAFHEDRGAQLLQLGLHAAALAGANILDVRAWCQNPDDELLAKILRRPGAAPGWADTLESMCAQGEEFLHSASASADAALGWMRSPKLAALACPRPGEGLDIPSFLRAPRPGTVYLIGRKRPYGSLTPFFAAFVTEFMEQAAILAEQSGGRLPVPLTIAADEAATTAKIDFMSWCAVTAGYNITVIAGFQAASQIPEGWGGEQAASTILTLFTTKIIAGGFTEDAELARFSKMCGEQDTWRHERGGKVRSTEQVFPPERIRQLKPFHALVVQRESKPAEVVIRPVWHHARFAPITIVPGRPAPADITEEQ